MTATVPLAVLLALSDAEIDWLVPGLREEKAALLIKSLPKALRRHVVPAPDFARAFIEAATPRAQPFATALAVFLSRVAGVDIREADFDASTLPAYLSFNLKVVDANGQPLAEGRELAALKARFAEAARAAFAARVDADFQRDKLTDWPLDEIPVDVRAEGGARAFPALYDQGTHAGLRAYADAAEAAAAHPRGVRRLVLIQIDDQLRYWQRHLKLSSDAQMAYGVVASIDALRRDLIESALDRVIGFGEAEAGQGARGTGNAAGHGNAASRIGSATSASPEPGAMSRAPSPVPRFAVRTRADFQSLLARVRQELGPEVQRLAERVDLILRAVKGLRSALAPPLMGYATANLADAREHLDSLVHPGFLREVGFERLAHYPRYLEGLRLRIERLKRDPAKDQVKLLEVLPFWRAWQRLSVARPDDAEVDSLRWLIEELRVSLFAQELKTAEPVSAKRLAKLVETLEPGK